jgi:hypothetical protein
MGTFKVTTEVPVMIPSKYGTAVVRNKKYPILQHCKHWLNMAEDDVVLK